MVRIRRPLALSGLRPQAKSILATLLAAQGWEERFPGGWVSNEQLADCAREFFSKDYDTISRACSRAAEQFAKLQPTVTMEKQRVSGSRQEQRRLCRPLSAELRTWFYQEGCDFLYIDTYRSFKSRSETLRPSLERFREAEVRALLQRGEYEKALAVARRLEHVSTGPETTRIARLLRITTLVRRGAYADLLQARRELAGFLQPGVTPPDIRAQTLLLQAQCRYWLEIYYADNPSMARLQALKIAEDVGAIAPVASEDPLRLQGRLRALEGLLLIAQADEDDPEASVDCLKEAEIKFMEEQSVAVRLLDGSMIARSFFHLGEVEYVRADLLATQMTKGPGEEDAETYVRLLHLLDRALALYRMCIEHARTSGSEGEHAAAFSRAAECHAWRVRWAHVSFCRLAAGTSASVAYLESLVDLQILSRQSFVRMKKFLRAARRLTPTRSWRQDYLASAEMCCCRALREVPELHSDLNPHSWTHRS